MAHHHEKEPDCTRWWLRCAKPGGRLYWWPGDVEDNDDIMDTEAFSITEFREREMARRPA